MVRFKGINHLAMVTGEMDKTIRFWRDLLGMRLVAGLGEPGYRHYFFEISPTDMLAFFEWPDVDPVEEKDHGYPVKGPIAFDHVSFGVETLDDLFELQDQLTAAGFPVSGVIDHGFIRSIYTWDPNGIPVEFSAKKPDVDVRGNPAMCDKEPTQTAKEGADPQPGHWPKVEKTDTHKDRRVYPGAGSELFHGTKKD
jgi:catechol 2,3-dioxygenase-like lactoylglutathione lyase family enzyme